MAAILRKLKNLGSKDNETAAASPRNMIEQEDSRVVALLAEDDSGVLRRAMISRREPGAKDVDIEILYAGQCHSDVHQLHNDWQGSMYPMVPGHEIFGIVKRVGSDVTKFSEGDRVGVGCMVESCRDCPGCNIGKEQYCPEQVQTYNAKYSNGEITYGGYSTEVVVDEHFVCSMPESIPDEAAAPLLCAGITVYSPLSRFGGLRQGAKVGVLGLGGLGHMAVKIAKAAGAEVTVISRSSNKESNAKELGADHYVAYTEGEPDSERIGVLDVVIDTIAFKHDVASFFKFLRPEGTLVAIGVPKEGDVEMNVAQMVMKGFAWSGSLIGGMQETQEMLDFCAEHGLWPDVEVIPASKANTAVTKLANGEVPKGAGRYVIDVKNSMANGEHFEME